jgi:hypothetical protein
VKIEVEDTTKARLAKWGPNKLFGDPDERKALPEPDLERLFDRVWQHELRHAVEEAEPCDPDDALSRLTEREREFFDRDQEHRQFRLPEKNIEFVAQLRPVADGTVELTQLWRISSTDLNPKTLYVTFATTKERAAFRQLAAKLGWNDEDLGLQLVKDFMAKVER